MNPFALGALAWLAASVIGAPLIGKWLRNRTPAPAASTPRAPEQAPVPGHEDACPRGVPAAGPHHAPAPGPRPRLLMSSRFYSDGVVYVDDHIKRQTTRFNPPPGDSLDLSDAALERWLNDGV